MPPSLLQPSRWQWGSCSISHGHAYGEAKSDRSNLLMCNKTVRPDPFLLLYYEERQTDRQIVREIFFIFFKWPHTCFCCWWERERENENNGLVHLFPVGGWERGRQREREISFLILVVILCMYLCVCVCVCAPLHVIYLLCVYECQQGFQFKQNMVSYNSECQCHTNKCTFTECVMVLCKEKKNQNKK